MGRRSPIPANKILIIACAALLMVAIVAASIGAIRVAGVALIAAGVCAALTWLMAPSENKPD